MQRLPTPAGADATEAHFAAIRAGSSVVAAEEYFRSTYAGLNAWNLRDTRMAINVEAIADHVTRTSGRPGKVVMWSHNTHSGDARATASGREGELNLGQLMKQQHGNRAFSIGFFTYSGSVFASSEWDQPGRVFDLRPALPGSYSALFQQTGIPAFMLLLKDNAALAQHLSQRLERAVGVIYARNSERQSHYFEATLPGQFDAAIFYSQTRAVRPLWNSSTAASRPS